MDHHLSEYTANPFSSLSSSKLGEKAPEALGMEAAATEAILHDLRYEECTAEFPADYHGYGPRTKPTIWYCCSCQDGPKNINTELSCIGCHHPKCTHCQTA